MTGDQTVLRLRDYAGSWMRLGYIGERGRESLDTAKGEQLPPCGVFILHLEGMLEPADLWSLGERLCEEGEKAMFEDYPAKQAAETGLTGEKGKQHAAAARAGQGTLFEE